MDCSMPGFSVYHQFPKLAQIHVHQVSDAIQPSHPLSSPSPPAFNLAQHQDLFQWISSSHQVAKVLELQHQYFQWLFRVDFQGTLKSLLQHHSSKASILWHSAFVMVQLSHPYMTAGKTIPLTIWTFVAKVMSLLLKRLSSFVIGFLPILNKCSNRDVKEWTIKLQLWVNFQEVTGDSNRSSPVHYLCDSGCAHLTPL